MLTPRKQLERLILVIALVALTLGLAGCRKTDVSGTTNQVTLPAVDNKSSPLPTPAGAASPLPTPDTNASPLQP
jgi:hypothetical protein